MIGDRTLLSQMGEPGNCWIHFTLNIGNKVIDPTKIQKMVNSFRWCVFDSGFCPNRRDFTFKSWTETGLTTYLAFTKNNVFFSFQGLQNKYDSGGKKRFLQIFLSKTQLCLKM